jgi:hypothetical protein
VRVGVRAVNKTFLPWMIRQAFGLVGIPPRPRRILIRR